MSTISTSTSGSGAGASAASSVSVSTKIDTHHVSKLDHSNYEQWRLQITLILKAMKLWDVVSGTVTRPAANPDKRDDKDIQAQAVIVPTFNSVNTNNVF